ncbi:MAG: response regulator transcription factor [Phycisphaerales bacterium]|nr:response regulator transcription factor [Phycisphaerales bacterium]
MIATPDILIIDGNAMSRTRLREALASVPGIRVAGEVTTAADALDTARIGQPGVILIDPSAADLARPTLISELREAAPECRIVVLTAPDQPLAMRQAISMGAAAVLSRHADADLAPVIRAVLAGRVFLDLSGPATLASVLAPNQDARTVTALERLSCREREVLRQVALGFTSQQVADDLGLSVKTVESYRARLMKKLALRERSGIVRMAIDAGLI